MIVRLLKPYAGHPVNAITSSLDASTEAGLIAAGQTSADLRKASYSSQAMVRRYPPQFGVDSSRSVAHYPKVQHPITFIGALSES